MNILCALQEWMFPNILCDADKARLEKLGTVVYRPDLKKETSEADYSKAIKEADAVIVMICWGAPKVTVKIMNENPQLKYLIHLSGELSQYIERDVLEKGLLVSNWGDVIARSVAEGALMMTLGALRKSTQYQFILHSRKGWNEGGAQAEGLFGQKVGLHGLGVIAQEYVKLIAPFGCDISAYSPNCPDDVFAKLGVKRAASLEDLYSQNRIISVHASKTLANHHIINAKLLKLIPDGGVIVNTARGAVIDTEALIAELKTGRIYAALDVFEQEPLPADSELRGLENCMLIPHMGGPTPDRRVDMGRLGVDNIERYIKGREVMNVITARKFDLMT